MKTTRSFMPVFLFCAVFLFGSLSSCSSSDDDPTPPEPPGTEEPTPEPTPDPDPDPTPEPPAPWPYPKLVSLWNHNLTLDVTTMAEELGINMIWTNDNAYTGEATWEQSHMYRSLQVPDVDYVFGKINRVAWGWTHRQSLDHARWVAELSKEHPEIIGLYMNDFYDEIEEGYRTEDQWREIIAAAKEVNPDLDIWVPHYPHRDQGQHAFDFDINGVIVNLWGNRPEQIANMEEHIESSLAHHPDKYVIAGIYLYSGTVPNDRWLTEEEFKKLLGYYVDLMNDDRLVGVRIFSAPLFVERPEYLGWAKEVLEGLER